MKERVEAQIMEGMEEELNTLQTRYKSLAEDYYDLHWDAEYLEEAKQLLQDALEKIKVIYKQRQIDKEVMSLTHTVLRRVAELGFTRLEEQ